MEKIHKRLAKNGLLVLGSTYNWNSDYTKREHWIGGYKQDGEPFTSLDGIEKILSQMDRRTKNFSMMRNSVTELKLYYSEFEQDFTNFFEELRAFSSKKLVTL